MWFIEISHSLDMSFISSKKRETNDFQLLYFHARESLSPINNLPTPHTSYPNEERLDHPVNVMRSIEKNQHRIPLSAEWQLIINLDVSSYFISCGRLATQNKATRADNSERHIFCRCSV